MQFWVFPFVRVYTARRWFGCIPTAAVVSWECQMECEFCWLGSRPRNTEVSMQTTAHFYASIQLRSSDIIFQPILRCTMSSVISMWLYLKCLKKERKRKRNASNKIVYLRINRISNDRLNRDIRIIDYRSIWNNRISIVRRRGGILFLRNC